MDEVVLAECSDGEELERTGFRGNGTWCPRLEEVEILYQRLKNEKVLEFQWKCPGRRNPNEEQRVSVEIEKPVVETPNASGAYDFDFDDDAGPVPQKLSSKTSTPKSAVKKRTTTLAGIVANMEKHRIMDKMGTETSPSKSSNN